MHAPVMSCTFVSQHSLFLVSIRMLMSELATSFSVSIKQLELAFRNEIGEHSTGSNDEVCLSSHAISLVSLLVIILAVE